LQGRGIVLWENRRIRLEKRNFRRHKEQKVPDAKRAEFKKKTGETDSGDALYLDSEGDEGKTIWSRLRAGKGAGARKICASAGRGGAGQLEN